MGRTAKRLFVHWDGGPMKVDCVVMSGEMISHLQDVLLLVAIDGSILDANPTALAYYGYSLPEMTSLHLYDLEAPQSLANVDAHLREAAEHGGVFSTIHRSADGTTFPVDMVSIPVAVGDVSTVLAIIRDTGERERSVQALRQSNELLQSIIDNTAATVYAKDMKGRFTLVNQSLVSQLGLPPETEVIGKTAHELAPTEIADEYVANDMKVIEGQAQITVEEATAEPDGMHTYVSTKFPLFDADGKMYGVCGMSFDITELKLAQQSLAKSNADLEQMVRDITHAMGRAVEVRDPYTQGHEVRVAQLAVMLAKEMGLSTDEVAGVEIAAVVHDIGKLGVPAEILSKPGALCEEEFAIVRRHSMAGYEILKGIAFPWPVAESVLQHHERIDGSGYPQGLRAADICADARILAVADVVEAMSSHRPYRPALGIDAAIAEIAGHPQKYDPDVVTACVRLYDSGRIIWQ